MDKISGIPVVTVNGEDVGRAEVDEAGNISIQFQNPQTAVAFQMMFLHDLGKSLQIKVNITPTTTSN